jgi:pimeloyl-ACP methyl ester carboxylesterase
MQIVIDSKIIRYDTYGSDGFDPILLLHGWGDNASGLRNLASSLAELNYKIVVPDLPGFGGSDTPKEAWGLNEYADWLTRFLAKIDVQPKVVIGHSNGGAVAIRALAKGAIKTEKLVLMASAGVRSNYEGRKKLLRVTAKSAKIITKLLPKKTQVTLKKRAYRAIGSDLFVAEHMQETFKKIVTDDVQNDAARIHVPTLLLYGDQDTATPPAYGELFAAQLPDAKLVIISGAGHFVHIDAASEVQGNIMDFIK